MRSTLHPIHKSKIKAFSYNEIKGEVQLACCLIKKSVIFFAVSLRKKDVHALNQD